MLIEKLQTLTGSKKGNRETNTRNDEQWNN